MEDGGVLARIGLKKEGFELVATLSKEQLSSFNFGIGQPVKISLRKRDILVLKE